jgi:flagellar hook-length control protein FliK
MSASPLPAVPVASQAPATSHVTQTSQSGNSAFGTHLQHAQQQASDAQDTSSQDSTDAQSTAQGSTIAQTALSSTSTATSSDNTAQTDDASNDSATPAMPTGIVSLANTVLNLIDQASGESSGKSGSTKAADNKTSAQAPNTTQQPSAIHAVAMLQPSVASPAAATSKDTGSTGASSTASISGSSGNSVAQTLQKAAANANNDDDDDDSVSASGSNASSAQSAGDATQALASTLSVAGHVSAAANTLPVTGNATGSTSDLTALSGVVGASAVATPAGTTSTATHALSVDAQVGSSSFAKELGQQVTWLSGQDIKQAQIKLNPQDLGPLDVKVSVEHGRVDVAFVAQHPDTVAAVQQGMDQLHQMLSGQGLSLGQATVGQQSAQQQFAGQQQQSSGSQTTNDTDTTEPSVGDTLKTVAVGLVDAFA